jgi:hypothetical protein
MSTMREDTDRPSFLSPVRRMIQPTRLDLEHYYPDRHFWKLALLEQYIVSEEEFEELRLKGWQEISDDQQPILLSLTSQLSLVLALKQRKKKGGQLQLWARATDIEHATHYPVVLTYSSLLDSSTETQTEVVVGTHAVIFDDSTVFCYELDQLGKEGKECWQRIVMGLQPAPLQRPYTVEEKLASHALLFVQAQEAALRLSQLYWILHEQKKQVPLSLSRTLPSPPNILLHGGMIIPQLDPVEGVLLALSHAKKEGGWKEVNAIPTYIHQKATSTTEVTVRPLENQVIPSDITNQLWQRVRQFNDVDGDILLAMLAQFLGSPPDPDGGGGTWITAQQILEYRGILPKIHKREKASKDETYRSAGHRMEDLQDVAEGVERIRDTHITVRTWKESHKPTKASKSARKRVYHHESYLVTISDYIQQSRLLLEEELPSHDESLAIAWYYRPGNCLDVFLTGPNYRAAWLLQQALHYDPYHEQWEKRLARYFIFQMRMNAELGGTTIKRAIGVLIDELALSLNADDPNKVKKRFEKAMNRLVQDGIISSWGPKDRYEHAMKQRPRYNWLDLWLAYEIEIVTDPLPREQAQSILEHLQSKRRRKTLLSDGSNDQTEDDLFSN